MGVRQESTKPEVGTLHASGKKGDAVSGQGIMAGVRKGQTFRKIFIRIHFITASPPFFFFFLFMILEDARTPQTITRALY